MDTFRSFFILEFKRSLGWRNVAAMLVFFVLSMYVIQSGVYQYNGMKKDKKEFQEVERLKVDQLQSYQQYGGYGFRLLFMPSPLIIFFNNSNLFRELTCRIDSGEKLNIYNTFKGRKVFVQTAGRWFDFSGIILLLGILMALFYGYDSLRHKEYLKFLASIYKHRNVFSYIRVSRMILLYIYFIVVFLSGLLLIKFNGIWFSKAEFAQLSIFLLMMLLMLAFFFFVGTFVACMKFKFKGFIIILTWFVSVYLVPVAIFEVIERRSERIPAYYQSELEKLRTLMDFEKEVEEKEREIGIRIFLLRGFSSRVAAQEIKTLEGLERWVQGLKQDKNNEKYLEALNHFEKLVSLEKRKNETGKPEELIIFDILRDVQRELDRLGKQAQIFRKQMLRRYLGIEFQKMQELEEKIAKEMVKHIRTFRFLSALFPSTCYLSINNEISSGGYENIVDFHRYAIDIKKEFMKFYTKRRLDRGKPESFIKEDKNIYHARGWLPGGSFGLGLGVILFFIVSLLYASYLRHKRSLFLSPGKDEEMTGLKELDIDLDKGKSNVVLSNREITISNHLYNVLSGQNREPFGKVNLDEVNIVPEKRKHDFVYLCQPEEIPPYIRAGDFVSFFRRALKLSKANMEDLNSRLNLKEIRRKNFGELAEVDKGMILFEIAMLNRSKIYMFHEFAKGMPDDFVKKFTNRLKKLKVEGASIFYITNDVFMGRRIGDYISFLKKEAILMTGSF
jgi:ABC-type branched-subunit amino acid transport system ATPase component